MIHQKVIEAKDVNTYKLLLRVLGEFCKRFPATGIDAVLNAAIDRGKKVLPTDKLALYILGKAISPESESAAVQALMNWRFAEVPIECRPVYKEGQKSVVAMWTTDDVISDRVLSLLRTKENQKSGKWTDINGDPVELIDMSKEEE